jgi:hypothetical protein
LIAGYIDIILKRRIDTDVVFEEDSDEIAEVETVGGDYGYAQYGITSSFSQPYQGQTSKPQLRSPGQQASFMAQEPNTMAQSQGEGNQNILVFPSNIPMF